ncbi:MAG: hypothetical protein NT027_12870 [Proteobacteria bacterium]|nr:hypothetical protein [Pseudomonadota bacterium]
MKIKKIILLFAIFVAFGNSVFAAADYEASIRRAQYLLNGTFPTNAELQEKSANESAYRSSVDKLLDHPNFYDVMLRYHEKLLGVGLNEEYVDELKSESIDQHAQKIATIACERTTGANARFRCGWASDQSKSKVGGCSAAQELPSRAFWYPGVTAWVCPTVLSTCGSDLSRCFINYSDQNAAKSSELGSTEIFDSSIAISKSLSKQSAGIAASVVIGGYPYTKILEPGLTAVDGAIAHLYKQTQHFDLAKMSIPDRIKNIVNQNAFNHTRFQLVYVGSANAYEHGGVLSSFGYLRRYEKNRTRANQLYQRLLCRQFTAELPRVFPQDPGNLRTTPGCMGCHATLDPLSDFFKVWGEGGGLYDGHGAKVDTTFAGKSGSTVSDLANIIRNDNAFGTCAVDKAWTWLMGRQFYMSEANLRAAFTSYFVTTNYNFKELIYSIATHPAFIEGRRGNALVTEALVEPPLGEPPGGEQAATCQSGLSYATHIAPKISICTGCHSTGNSTGLRALDTEQAWSTYGRTAVGLMASGNMPPGQAGPPLIGPVYELKEAVRCWKEQNP